MTILMAKPLSVTSTSSFYASTH